MVPSELMTMGAPLITIRFVASVNTELLEDFTTWIETEASHVRRKVSNLADSIPISTAQWVFDREQVTSYAIDDELKLILRRLGANRERFLSWSKDHYARYTFSSEVYKKDERPLYILSPDVMGEMAAINATWEIKIHCRPDLYFGSEVDVGTPIETRPELCIPTGLTLKQLAALYPLPSKPQIKTAFAATIHTGALNDFASRIKITPSRTRRKGDKTRSGRDFPVTEWVLERTSPPSPINVELKFLLKSLWPYREELRSWKSENSVDYGFRSWVYIDDESPPYVLDSEVMAQMAFIGAQWDIAVQHCRVSS